MRLEKIKEFIRERFKDVKWFIYDHKKVFTIVGGIILGILAIGVVIFVVKGTALEGTTTTEAEIETESTTEEVTTTEEEITTEADESDDDDPNPDDSQSQTGVIVDVSDTLDANNDYEVSGITYGIDVSKWQGEIDWEAVADAGIEYAMIRVGYRTEGNGTICEDSYAQYNMQEASEAGILVGVYFFSTATTTEEAEEEAAWVVDYIAKYNITYPVVYNCEGFTDSDSRMYSLTNTERTNNAIAFMDYIADSGYTPMLYASSSELTNSAYWDTDTLESSYKIWVAQYPGTTYSSSLTSSYSGTYAMWQYTNKGLVDGIDGYVDLSVAYFGYTSEAEAKDTSGAEEVTVPEVTTTEYDPYEETDDQVTAKISTNLRSSADQSSDDNIVYTLQKGEYVERIAIGTNGWSKVIYNGQTLYAVTTYLTTSADEDYDVDYSVYTETDDQVTAKVETNLRSSADQSDSSNIVYTLENGEYVERIATGTNGWSIVIYNGQTLYAVTSYLTTE